MANTPAPKAVVVEQPVVADQPETPANLDTTVPGGKYLAADGKTFVDANGKPLKGKAEDGE